MKILKNRILTVILLFLTVFIRAYIFMTLWNWFVPVVFGLNKTTYPAMLGIILIITFFKKREERKEDFEYGKKEVLKLLFDSLYYLGFGWLLTFFI